MCAVTVKISLARRLALLEACPEAIEWVGRKKAQSAWDKCERGDWMMWLIQRCEIKDGSPEHKSVIRCSIDFAKLSLPEWEKYSSTREPHLAIEAAERFVNEWSQEAGSAARAAVYSAADSAGSAARSAQADIIRKHFPVCPFGAGQ